MLAVVGEAVIRTYRSPNKSKEERRELAAYGVGVPAKCQVILAAPPIIVLIIMTSEKSQLYLSGIMI